MPFFQPLGIMIFGSCLVTNVSPLPIPSPHLQAKLVADVGMCVKCETREPSSGNRSNTHHHHHNQTRIVSTNRLG
uniref:Putative secreted protein n=1 Tax=Anopheles marajoara TaxID=58244 RepID=A0A2M4CCX5_9DIPT